MSQDEPIYNIGVVSRMTGIPAATLRVWERRYDFPETSRTEGGHRLYSETDVQQLRWVKAKTDEGMQIRQAVKALRVLEEESLTTVAAPANTAIRAPYAAGISLREAGAEGYLGVLQKTLFEALTQHDTGRSDDVFSEALALFSPEDVMLDVIRPTLWAIGEGWAQGDISIGTEHLATSYLRQRLLAWLRAGPPLYPVPTTVLACAPGEYHEGSLMIFGALLRRRRWPVAYLGQSIPLADLAGFVAGVDASAVVTVAMSEETAGALLDWPSFFPAALQVGRPIFAFGGLVFSEKPEWRSRIPGLFLGNTLAEGVETLERALQRLHPPLD